METRCGTDIPVNWQIFSIENTVWRNLKRQLEVISIIFEGSVTFFQEA